MGKLVLYKMSFEQHKELKNPGSKTDGTSVVGTSKTLNEVVETLMMQNVEELQIRRQR